MDDFSIRHWNRWIHFIGLRHGPGHTDPNAAICSIAVPRNDSRFDLDTAIVLWYLPEPRP